MTTDPPEHAETDPETDDDREHAPRCGCVDCDPDSYADPAELLAGLPGDRW